MSYVVLQKIVKGGRVGVRRPTTREDIVTLIETPRSQYAQVAELIRRRIEDGTYPRGSMLPSEPELAAELNISRVTINKAISLLRTAGLVRVRRGSGTVVRGLPQIMRDAQRRYAARDKGTGVGEVEVTELNLRSRTDYGEIARRRPPAEVAAVLGLTRREDVLIRPRVLYANDEPTQIADSYYPWSIAKRSKELLQPDSGPGGSYGRLADLGFGPTRFTEDVTVRLPTDHERRVLDLEPTQPVFEVWHVAYTADDRPVEVCVHVMPGYLWKLRYAWDERPAVDSMAG
jgi:GntR family transcriptional regulator